MSQASGFSHAQTELESLAARALELAARLGATSAEAEVSEGFGQNITVRLGEVETIEYTRDKGLGVTVYMGQRRGHASSSDFSAQAIENAVRAAADIARFTAEDPCAGLADEDLLATDYPAIPLYYPWHLSVEEAIQMAVRCEQAGLAVDPRIHNSEGATVSSHQHHFVYANSAGFSGGYAVSRHGLSATLIAGQDDAMQRDYWYSTAREHTDLETPEQVGRRAGERAVRRLGARKVDTAQVPVLYEAPLASGLIGHFVGAVSGGALYRKSSFLLDALGQPVFAPSIQIQERAHLPKGLASSPFDNEGVRTQDRDIVVDGVLQGYFLSTYAARKLGMRSTGNAGGCHNLIIANTGEDFAGLLRKMGRGLLVTELLGQGVNPVTGDYSRGAAGFWVEDGAIAYPVEEVTVAGNLKDMYRQIDGVGSDVLARGSKQVGSILVQGMTVAGS